MSLYFILVIDFIAFLIYSFIYIYIKEEDRPWTKSDCATDKLALVKCIPA